MMIPYLKTKKRRGPLMVFGDEDNELENIILTILDIMTVKRNPSRDNVLSDKNTCR